MASWTDNVDQLTRFNPYVQQQPVDAMVAVGMQREEQFQQGVQRVQSYYDNLLALPISKAETQNYVKQKVGELNNAVQQSLQGDFSDSRLTNQIGGLATKIASDPIVQNGVLSTAAIQSGYAKLQEAQKAGKSAPQNEEYFQNIVSKWQNDGDVTSTFSGSYTPHTDYIKKFTELYKESHPGENIPDDAFRIGEDGQVTVNPTVLKGVQPEKLQALWNVVASQPDVQGQLNIDGWSRYRGATPEMMYKSFAEDTNFNLKNIEDSINTLQTQLATDSSANSTKISAKIDQLKQIANQKKTRFAELTKGLKNNPDGVKSAMVAESVSNNLINGFSYQTMEKSPLWETSMEKQKFGLEMAKFREEQRWHDLQYNKDLLEIQSKADKAAKEKKAASASGDIIITDAPITTPEAQGSFTAMQDRDNAGKAYVQTQRKLANDLSTEKKPYYLNESGQYVPNIGPGATQFKNEKETDDAAMLVLGKGKDDYVNGRTTDETIRQGFRNADNAYTTLKNKEQVISDVQAQLAPQIEQIKKSLPKINTTFQANPIGGAPVNIPVTEVDVADKWSVVNNAPDAQAARARIEGKFGKSASYFLGPYYTPEGYDQVAKAMDSNPTVKGTLNQVEAEYRRRQTVEMGKVITYDANEDKDRASMANKFGAIVDRVKDLDPSSTSGDINALENLLKPDDKTFKGYRFSSKFDKNNAYLTVTHGDQNVQVRVPREQYFQVFSDQKVTSDFNDKFGSKLALNRQQYTGLGRTEAEVVDTPKTSPYAVQYTLEKNPDGSYNMRLWVTPKGKDTSIIPGMFASGIVPGMPPSLSEEDVLNYDQKFKDPNFVQQVLLYKQKIDELNNQ